jgi:hypothetical protein
MNGNGSDPPDCLDRIEAILEVVANQHMQLTEEHTRFAQEHRQLLAAQVVLTDRVTTLAEAQKHTDEGLNSLIRIVDDIIQKRGS